MRRWSRQRRRTLRNGPRGSGRARATEGPDDVGRDRLDKEGVGVWVARGANMVAMEAVVRDMFGWEAGERMWVGKREERRAGG